MFSVATIKLGPLELDMDAPWWVYACWILIGASGLTVSLFFFWRMTRKGKVSFQRYHPAWRMATIILMVVSAVYLFQVAQETFRKIATNTVSYGEPVAFSRMISRFNGSVIVFCVPNVANDTNLDAPWYLGGFLYNEPKVRFSLLGSWQVGVNDLNKQLENSWQEGPDLSAPKVNGKTPYVIRVRIAKPTIDESAGVPFTKDNKMSDEEAKAFFGDAWVQCGGRSGFRKSSGGGLLIRIGEMAVGPGTGRFNDAQQIALKKARILIEKPDKRYGGRSLYQKAQDEAVQSLKEVILAANPEAKRKLEEEGYDVQVVIDVIEPSV